MRSVVLVTATRLLLPLLLVFSIFILSRGHNEPGGGFVGGLVAAAAFVLFAIARDVSGARAVLRIDPRVLIGIGLLFAITSGLLALFLGMPYMTGIWFEHEIPLIGTVGTPILFDLGVYCVVIGSVLTIIFTLAEE